MVHETFISMKELTIPTMEVDVTRMTSKGQLVIPQDIRESLGLKPGDKFMVVEEERTILLRPVKEMKKDAQEELYALKRAAIAWKSLEQGEGEEWTLSRIKQEIKR